MASSVTQNPFVSSQQALVDHGVEGIIASNRHESRDFSQDLAQANPLKHCKGARDVEEIGRPLGMP